MGACSGKLQSDTPVLSSDIVKSNNKAHKIEPTSDVKLTPIKTTTERDLNNHLIKQIITKLMLNQDVNIDISMDIFGMIYTYYQFIFTNTDFAFSLKHIIWGVILKENNRKAEFLTWQYVTASIYGNSCISSGHHSYSFKVYPDKGFMCIGLWRCKSGEYPPTKEWFTKNGQGYGYLITQGKKSDSTGRYKQDYGVCVKGGVVVMDIDFKARTLSFIVNNKPYGISHKIPPYSKYRVAVTVSNSSAGRATVEII